MQTEAIDLHSMAKINVKLRKLSAPRRHVYWTKRLAAALKGKDVFDWLETEGYFPEPYVLPPCFHVRANKNYGAPFTKVKKSYKPKLAELVSVHFPKSDWTDRAFGIIDPEIHYDIAVAFARNWKKVIKTLFRESNVVASYSFPVPLDKRHPQQIGRLRSGRLIYEFIEMAERDLAQEAFKYRYLVTTDVKNFYPSIYTHSLAWALHGKKYIRKGARRHDGTLLGNRLDRLFQNANDGCTNGIPIGPAVSDLAAEIVLSAVDNLLSERMKRDKRLDKRIIVVRFKDDYRVLSRSVDDGKAAIKHLQTALKEFHLELNEEKTESHLLPDGLFRGWVSEYHAANPRPKSRYGLKRFREVYLAVVRIDQKFPGTGVVDRFLADIVSKNGNLRFSVDRRSVTQIVSLILMLAHQRIKAFPKALAVVEVILRTTKVDGVRDAVGKHLGALLTDLVRRDSENAYLISWVVYFMRANRLERHLPNMAPTDRISRAVLKNRFSAFGKTPKFKIFQGVIGSSKRISLLTHLDVFPRK